MIKDKYLIGSDPELFVTDAEGKFVSAHDLMPGTKDMPYYVPGGAIQVDGTAAEFNTEPCGSYEEFQQNLDQVQEFMLEQIRGNLPGALLSASPVATFQPEYFESLPEEARMLGCMPDFCAYTDNCMNPTPNPGNAAFRTGSFHIHIGWTEYEDINDPEFIEQGARIVRHLDHSLFLYSFLWDKDTRRRSLYGKAGAFRPKHYGTEYRPLSNACLRSKETTKLVWDITEKSLGLFEDGVFLAEDKQLNNALVATDYGLINNEKVLEDAWTRLSKEYGFDEIANDEF